MVKITISTSPIKYVFLKANQKGITMEDFTAKFKRTEQTIERWKKGKLNYAQFIALCEFVGVELSFNENQ